MRSPATSQDHLRFPLNHLLGTHANLRLMRVLAEEVSGPIGAPEAAELAGLTEAGARQALKRLANTPFVERLGGGRAQRFRLRDEDSLVGALRHLFAGELARYEHFITDLREILGGLTEIKVAWIVSPSSVPGRPVELGVLADARSLGYLREQLRQRILEVEQSFDTTVEIHLYSPADLPEVEWKTSTIVVGHATEGMDEGRSTKIPHERTFRASRMSRAISQMLERNPSLLKRAQRHVELLLQHDQGPASHDLQEWRDLLAHYSAQRIRDFLLSEAPRAQRLRHSSPFFAVLTAEEREELIEMIEAAE